ncbi:MAG TPA: DUF3108 domain-containing protein [Longimicrobium sp.]|nr:DUF3108 domain-containing protein [Longimicrobium sp.]
MFFITSGESPRKTAMRMLLAAAMAGGGASPAQAQQAALPFSPGETCVYRGSNVLGRIGTGTFAVEPADGGTVLLRFDFRGRVGPAAIEDRSRSWFDTAARGSRRFTRRERSPLASRDEDVRMDASARRWTAAAGGGGAMSTDAPLDELSFIYFVRTLRLAEGDSYSLARHYDTARNPVRVRVVGRGSTEVPAGRFRTIQVEMRVHDRVRYQGEGVIRMHITDDARRVPVRIESSIPRAGRMVLSLESGSGGCGPASLASRAD